MWIDDQILENADKRLYTKFFVPENPLVVLGRSNKAETEANLEACQRDNVSIVKRYGGGGTVLLHSGCVVVSIGAWMNDPFQNDRYFRLLNEAVLLGVNRLIPDREFSQRGFSDLVEGQRKFAGTSLFRSKNYLLYQNSILVDPRIKQITKYLSHPSKEPDYRKGRSHRDFLVGLKEFLPSLHPSKLASCFDEHLESDLMALMKDDLGQVQSEHIIQLEKRIERSKSEK